MALHNLARVTSATTGTGTLTLGSAVSGFLTFADAGVSDGEQVVYAIRDGTASEIGLGIYTASGTTLSRATIYESTNSGNAINCSGSQEVFITPAAESFPNHILDSYLYSSGNARNDEFNSGPSIDAKWTLVGTTPDSIDVGTTLANNLYLRRNDTGAQLSVYYQDLPSLPCDIVLKVNASTRGANFCRGGGIVVLPSSPTTSSAASYFGMLYNSNLRIDQIRYSNLSTFSAQGGAIVVGGAFPIWLRMTILSGGTTADLYYSADGHFWTLLAGTAALGLTAANAGIGLAPEGQAADLEALFDFYRVS